MCLFILGSNKNLLGTILGDTTQHLGSHRAGRWAPAFKELPGWCWCSFPICNLRLSALYLREAQLYQVFGVGGRGSPLSAEPSASLSCTLPLNSIFAQREHGCCHTLLGLATCCSHAWVMPPSILSAWLLLFHPSAPPFSGIKDGTHLGRPRVGINWSNGSTQVARGGAGRTRELSKVRADQEVRPPRRQPHVEFP